MTDAIIAKIESIGWTVEPGGCCEWRGTRDRRGPGPGRAKINLSAGNRNVIRVLWEARVGPVPAGEIVALRCMNPGCVNLEHAYLTTREARVALERGRKKLGRSGRRTTLTEEQLRTVLHRYATEDVTQRTLAAELSVTEAVVQRAIKNAGIAKRPGRRSTVSSSSGVQ